jgi:putative ABC transport system permease protein
MFRNYIKTAYRNLLRQKGFSGINISGLTLGLTACLLIALFVRDEYQYDRFIPDGEQVYRLYTEQKKESGTEYIASTPPMFAATLQQEFPEVEASVRVLRIGGSSLAEVGEKQIYQEGGIITEDSFFEVLPLPFVQGSGNNSNFDPTSIFISEAFAHKIFGAENPVGKEVSIDKESFQVKGVFKSEDLKFHLPIHYILPMRVLLDQIEPERMESWVWQQFYSYIRLKKGSSAEALQAKFQTLVAQKSRELSQDHKGFNYNPVFQPLHNIHLHSADFKNDMAERGNITYVRALSIIAIFVLLIACFNFVNLATAKSLQRAKEVGVRKTIGASRSQLMGQFLMESGMLTCISILLAIGFSSLLLPWLNQFAEKRIQLDLFTNPLMLLGLFGLLVLVGLVAGFYPALVLSRFQPVKVLKGAAAGNTRPGQIPWLRHSLVVVQFSISILLIISALVVYRQVEYLNTKALGFNKEEIMFFPMRGANMNENYKTFKNELSNIPGVSAVSIGYGFPGDAVAGDGIKVPGESKEHSVTHLMVDYDYIKTLDLEMLAGRNFSEDIRTDKDYAFILNETAVNALGFDTPNKALGQALEWNSWAGPDSVKRGQIIGVVKDFHYKSLYDRVEPAVLQIFPPANWKVAVKIETAGMANVIEQVKGVWQKFSPEYPIEYNFLDESFDQMYKAEAKLKSLLWVFTGMAILVGCLGLFGLAAYAAERRTKEIGIRKVLGATERHIVVLLSGDFLKLVLIAILIASPIAWYFMSSWLQDFAYRIDISWWVFALAGLGAITIALITVSFHAIKAALRNPVKNLRIE